MLLIQMNNFFTSPSLPQLYKNVALHDVQRPDYKFLIDSPFLKERELKYSRQQQMIQEAAQRLSQKRTLQQIRLLESNPLFGFPQEPNYKSFHEYYLANENIKHDWVQLKFEQIHFFKSLWSNFKRLKKEIVLQEKLLSNKRSKKRILMTLDENE